MSDGKRFTNNGKVYEKDKNGVIREVKGATAASPKSDAPELSATKKKELQDTKGLGALSKRNKARKKAKKEQDDKPENY